MNDFRIKGEVLAPKKLTDTGESLKRLYVETVKFTAVLVELDPKSDNLGPLLDPYANERRPLHITPKKIAHLYALGDPIKPTRAFEGLKESFNFKEFHKFMEARFTMEKVKTVSSIQHTLPAQDRLSDLHNRTYTIV